MNRFQEFFSGEFNIQPGDGHFKVYRWWMQHSGKTQATQVNFCRYFWTVVLKAPFMRLFQVPLYRFIYPWMVLTPLVFGAFWAFDGTRPWAILPTFVFVYVGLITFLVSTRHGKELLKLLEWFFLKTWHSVISPWSITAFVVLGSLFPILGVSKFLELLKNLGVGLGFIAAAIVAVFIVVALFMLLREGFLFLKSIVTELYQDFRDRLGFTPSYHAPQAQASSTFRMVGQYISAKKRRICPLVNLPV